MRKFETKSVFANGKWDEIYFVDGENVTEEEYFGAMESEELDEEYENANDDEECECEDVHCNDECPRCSMIREMAEDVWNADNEDEAFAILKDIINMVEYSGYKEGYKNCLDNQINKLSEIKEHIEKE